MRKSKKLAAIMCAVSVLSASLFLNVAYAESVTATNRIQKTTEEEPETPLTFKERLARMKAAEEKEKLSAIPEGHAYIPEDTILHVELTEEISSKTMHKGDRVPLVLQENLIVNDTVVVPAGTEVEGIVTKVKKNGMFGRSGKLEFSINSVTAVNGVRIPLQYLIKKEAGSDGGAVAVATAVSLIGGLFMKGKNVSFPAGSVFEARVTSDTDLNVTLEELPEAMNPNKPHGVAIVIQ